MITIVNFDKEKIEKYRNHRIHMSSHSRNTIIECIFHRFHLNEIQLFLICRLNCEFVAPKSLHFVLFSF